MKYIFYLLLFCSSLLAAPPKVVVFDYGGVIAKVDRKPILKFLSLSLKKPYAQIEEDFAGQRLYRALNQPRTYWEKYAKHTVCKGWLMRLDNYKLHLAQHSPEMRQLIKQLKAQGIRVALLSNTNAHRAYFLKSWGAYAPFDPVLLSPHLGVRKPHPMIYQIMLQRVGVSAEECVFIDNKLANIEAALEFGIDGIVFESVEQIKEELKNRDIHL